MAFSNSTLPKHLLVLLAGLALAAPAAAQTLDALRTETKKKYAIVVTKGQVPANLQVLHTQLSDRDAAVRIKAVQSLSLIGGPMGALLLSQTMDDSIERIAAVRIETARGLGEIGGRQALEVLGIGLDDRDVTVRKRVVEALRWAGTVFSVPYIQEALRNDRDVGVRLESVRMLRKIGTQFSIQPLVERITADRDVSVRLAAADALGEIGKKEIQVAQFLGEAYRQEKNTGVKLKIVGSLGLVRNRSGLPYLREAMQDRNLTVRMRATEVYGRVLGLQ